MTHRPFTLLLLAGSAAATHAAPPITWQPPASFDAEQIGLGLPPLDGARHTVIYDPRPVEGDAYPSTKHGLYNHHPMMLWMDEHLVVYWTNHAVDENAAGQRVLASVGVYDAATDELTWPHAPVEVVPPVSPLHRRPWDAMPMDVDPRFAHGNLRRTGDALLSEGSIALYWGWTDVPGLRQRTTEPIDAAHFHPGRTDTFRFDMRWIIGPSYAQAWTIRDEQLAPTSELHLDGPMIDELRMADGYTLHFPPPLPPYDTAPSMNEAPAALRALMDAHRRQRRAEQPRYAPGDAARAKDGPDALAHQAEFRRPDGTRVIVRDNLMDPGCYYAAERAGEHETYPPAERTNLFGDVLPAAGELPDGRCFIVANTLDRRTLYLTLSRDGRVFDRSWFLLHIDKPWTRGLGKSSRGGPQYTQAAVAHGNLWLLYSIGKQQLGLTQVPLHLLDEAE